MLQSISLRFDPVEDRLLLRLTVQREQAEQVHWLHLTRRACIGWRADLQKMVDSSADAPQRLDPVAKAALSAAHHEAMSAGATRRTEPPIAPEPALRPALVTSIACGRRRSDGRWLISFNLQAQPSLTLVLSGQTLHGLVDALTRHVQAADWGLPALPVEARPVQSPGNAPLH
ncbi:MAG: hypothetical protein HY021_05410 [Burkholderiales bacterium]|nr:hypothetical protein [Burkholderiales bacterium]